MKILDGEAEVRAAAGTVLGTSPWRSITQELIDGFADLTGDHQWIHVDPDRAQQGPFGTTIAHGLLTLALVPSFLRENAEIRGTRMIVNYGLDRVRFVTPVRRDARMRAVSTLTEVTEVEGGLQVVFGHVLELDSEPRPACVCRTISRCYFPASTPTT